MKKIILLAAAIIISACSSTKTDGDKWIGQTKRSIMKSLGAPVRTLNNDTNGEILIYADQVYTNSENQNGSTMVGSNYWKYTFVYINNEGKVSSWRNEKQEYPPQQIDAKKLIGVDDNMVSVK
ncbi:hypothetical protein IRZ71_07750 [Flavobacterium sp. ANB]|uniref:hypothetical protein n=1 Tax=unclassified Flavobacterium TaxID=196869 RepID=UPI0012B96170|nr:MULTISPECIES: hypothetical protein [unclassified Flavobacterium]MBF4516230.1 hypothetical protein [Flavobacterium sp. ANB]MTD69873.1 hypothetical protein [Flavobacterium sp. LC2016-13]